MFSRQSLTLIPVTQHLDPKQQQQTPKPPPKQQQQQQLLQQAQPQRPQPNEQQQKQQKQKQQAPEQARVPTWSVALGAAPPELAPWLNFSSRTVLNFFHNHKTGGTLLAGRVRQILALPSNQARRTVHGCPLCNHNTCAPKNGRTNCDTVTLRPLSQAALERCPIILGHQYFDNGADMLFLRGAPRTPVEPLFDDEYADSPVRHFTTLRHPLARRLSAYHHFKVRNQNETESSVTRADLLAFLMRTNRTDVRSRFCGANYYASHLLSDGQLHHNYHLFTMPPRGSAARTAMMRAAERRVRSRFVVVGLQTQLAATLCMVGRLLRAFAHAQGLARLDGLERLGDGQELWNNGTYPWTAPRLWASMDRAERDAYVQHEEMDYAIYRASRQVFRQHVRSYGCAHLVDERAMAADVFE